MSDIFLSRVNIRNFRTFGEFDIEIPAAPGLTIISGTNGLGKSNFFDAIEWGLTGQVQRFQDYAGKKKFPEGHYLTRAGATSGSHTVKLGFSNQYELKRSQGYATPQSEIIGLLTKEGKTIHDLQTYLALTHFLGQSSTQRFTSRDEREQWKALRGPSGIDRLESVRESIKHRSITIAFNSRIAAEKAAIAEIEGKLALWAGWQARLALLQQTLHSTGNLTPAEVQHRIAKLEQELSAIFKDSTAAIEGEAPAQRLIRLGKLITTGLDRARQRAEVLTGLASLVDAFRIGTLNADPQHPLWVRASRDVSSARAAVGQASTRTEQALAGVEAQSSAIRNLEQDISLLESTRSDYSRQQESANQIKTAETERSRLSEAISERQAAVLAAESQMQNYSGAVATAAELRRKAENARLLVESHHRLVELDAAAARDSKTLAEAQAAATGARPNLDSAIAERDTLKKAIDTVSVAYADSERQAGAISAAVATIASHIDHSDTKCPVCTSSFKAGELKLLAETAARSENENLARLARELADLGNQLSPLSARIEALTEITRRPEEILPSLSANIDLAARARKSLAAELDLEASADLGTAARVREQLSLAELSDAMTKQDELAGPSASASERRRTLIEEIESLVGQEGRLNTNLNLLRDEEKACSERISARGMASFSMDAVNERLSEQRTKIEVARTNLIVLSEELANARSTLDNMRQILSVAERDLADAERARLNAQEQLADIELRWNNAALEGKPNQVTLNDAVQSNQVDAAELRKKQGAIEELANINQNLLLQDELDEILAFMTSAGGEDAIAHPEAYVERLKKELLTAQQGAQTTLDAQRSVNSYSGTLRSDMEEYSAQVLAPLNDVIASFNDAMLSSPGPSIRFNARHRVDSTILGMTLQNRSKFPSPASHDDMPPQLMLSEGQIAANGFSILCAASTAYQWSRWRALLLDDPLQHNDIIHTAAFIDVMRNMVELNGYQLLMSSHDKGESDFIARKFDAAGLPCTRITLTGPSENGVLLDEPTYNSAAKAVMNRNDDGEQSLS